MTVEGKILPEVFAYMDGRPGVQSLYYYNNGWGASVINHMGSYGNELGVIQHNRATNTWHLYQDSPITASGGGVIGYLNTKRLNETLALIKALPDNRTFWQRVWDRTPWGYKFG